MLRLSPWLTWAIFSAPALVMAVQFATSDTARIAHDLVHPSGEFAARFLIVAMMATPLALVLRGWRGPAWLRRNRRYLGVAAFGYAALHTALYLIDKGNMGVVLEEVPRFYILTGWLAFAIFLPLAATSADWAVRAMGTWWKWLQRWTYAAAVLTLLHWAALHDWGSPWAAVVHFAPLAVLEAYRVWYWYLRPREVASA